MSIGHTLAAARRDAGLSIDDISEKTRVRATIIRAIENDDFSLCGGDFYARGHLRTIARIVGVDPAAVAAEFDATVAAPEAVPAASQVFEAETVGRTITKRTDRRAPHWGLAAAVMVLVAVIVGAALQLGHHSGGAKPEAVTGQTSTSPSTSTSPPSPAVTTLGPLDTHTPPPSTAVAPRRTELADDGVHIVLTVTTAPCWVSATASDGDVLYQGTLQPGQSKTWDDSQRIALKLGNAPATDLVVNGVDIGAPTSTTDVASVSFGPGDPTTAQG